MRTLAFPLAVLIVAGTSLVALAAVVLGARWSRWMLAAGGAVGVAGLAVTAAALVNLAVPRACDGDEGEELNRPAILLVIGDGDCLRSSVLQTGLVPLAVAIASGATASFRRSGRGGGGAVPVAPLP